MVNEHSVSYHPSNSNFRSALSASSLPRIFVEFSVNSVYSTMFGKYFQICGVQITGKCIVNEQVESKPFYSCLPKVKSIRRFLSSLPQAEENYLFPQAVFL